MLPLRRTRDRAQPDVAPPTGSNHSHFPTIDHGVITSTKIIQLDITS